MINWLSSLILDFIYGNSDLSSEIKDIYKYGIEITLSSVLNIVLVFGASIIIGDIIAGVMFLLIFVLLSSFTGGYHASTYLRCNSIKKLNSEGKTVAIVTHDSGIAKQCNRIIEISDGKIVSA